MIHLLWPTIRPDMMSSTFTHWVTNCADSKNFKTHIAVNTKVQKTKVSNCLKHIAQILYNRPEVYISGNKKGVTNACCFLSHLQNIDGPYQDIIILASDDFYAPKKWDKWLIETIQKPVEAIRVNDGYIPQDNITIPIMTMGCLKKLNRIIYHTSYHHSYSDTELFHNLKDLEYLTDLWNSSPIFEHKNWANNKRSMDDVDIALRGQTLNDDANNYNARMLLPVEKRILAES